MLGVFGDYAGLNRNYKLILGGKTGVVRIKLVFDCEICIRLGEGLLGESIGRLEDTPG